jgi:hypothetical protein
MTVGKVTLFIKIGARLREDYVCNFAHWVVFETHGTIRI